ncbi:hypothetical protein GUITHDRAFT_110892 [Guillardia theta CCMP2712]|uniref:Acyl carrier protein n=2 Tax=Guillardia theta TaxID=55529 RepID=L1J501_GUITC|nr:hypothetical protein GUITHDRAFT_110892 [Guillardia theta CCMP2712]EKX43165.1 hypothetical protein GUITHDRAFT_110892 [Guillardia theta CCMP2712]|eukprot:XP_005830145.1 hypothetical protein GUITHDRAFT_110892 [Guillardia theta CCMP2712]
MRLLLRRPQLARPLTFSVPVNARFPHQSFTVRAFSSGGFLPKQEVQERVLSVVKNFEGVDVSKVSETAHFMNDLGLDSLDTVEIVMAFEDEFAIEIPDAEAEKIQTVEQAISYVASHPQAK